MNVSTNKIIIWDFNGTLLDDTDHCVKTMNKVLTKRGYKPITVPIYRDIFGFPVKNYYKAAGFNLEIHPFEELSDEFITGYYNHVKAEASLHDFTHEVLEYFQSVGIKQYILSAMEHNSLIKLTKHFDIYKYFDDVWGIDDHHAKGKVQIAKKHLDKFKGSKLFYIGDTDHDVEVAKVLQAKMVIHPNGSQSKHKLKKFSQAILVNNLKEIINHIDNL